jgi:hypothetical protein
VPVTNGPALEGFVIDVLKIQWCDFMAFVVERPETHVVHAKRLAQVVVAGYGFLQGLHRKDTVVDEIVRKRPVTQGLICVLCCMGT